VVAPGNDKRAATNDSAADTDRSIRAILPGQAGLIQIPPRQAGGAIERREAV
jgi:hypothetical protein